MCNLNQITKSMGLVHFYIWTLFCLWPRIDRIRTNNRHTQTHSLILKRTHKSIYNEFENDFKCRCEDVKLDERMKHKIAYEHLKIEWGDRDRMRMSGRESEKRDVKIAIRAVDMTYKHIECASFARPLIAAVAVVVVVGVPFTHYQFRSRHLSQHIE